MVFDQPLKLKAKVQKREKRNNLRQQFATGKGKEIVRQ